MKISRHKRSMAGAVLALALVGALSAGMASGADRLRRRKPARPATPPPRTEEAPARAAPSLQSPSRLVALPVPGTEAWDVRPRGAQGSRPATVSRRAKGHPHVAAVPTSAPEANAPAPEASPSELQATMLPATTRVPVPLRVSWREVDTSAATVQLIARLERSPGFTAPVKVSLEGPARALLQDGPTSPLVLGVDVEELRWTLRLPEGTRPDGDLVLLASAGDASFGVHAEARYRFGRTLGAPSRPSPSGPPLPDGLMLGQE
jgi:hypothetical protein